VFLPSSGDGAFHQGEVLSNVVQLCLLPNSQQPDDLEFQELVHPFAVILTQECDLDWDFKARTVEADESKRDLKVVPNILLCEAFPEASIRPKIKGSELWRRITNNQDQRYHQIPLTPSASDSAREGLPALTLDFKHIFTIRTDELTLRLNLELRRRTILQVPWVQDLGNRFAYYCGRVALPEGDLSPIALPQASIPVEKTFIQKIAGKLTFGLLRPGK
jgi:hypothetical protein